MNTAVKRILAVLMLLHTIAYAADVKTITLYFAKDQYTLTAGEGQKLQALKNADVVFMQGYTDNDGSDAYNIQLSKNRVQAVRRAVNALAPQVRVETEYFGEKDPVNNNAGEAEKTLNRRVTVSYICDPLLRTKVSAQFFEIDNSTEQTIKCKEGTQVVIPAGAFGNQKVLINVCEYYNPLQIFAANLSTHSNGRPIETAGMIHITAEANGKRVEPQKELTYKFPRKNMSKDFRFFAGERDSSYNMNWVTSTSSQLTPSSFVNEESYLGYISARGSTSISSNIVGEVSEEYRKCQTVMADSGIKGIGFSLSRECFDSSEVYIKINADGRITSLTTSFTDKNTENDRALQQFVRSVLPTRFAAHKSASSITTTFSFNQAIPLLVKNDAAPVMLSPMQKAEYETGAIVLKAAKLGWINCDRFLSQPTVINYTIKSDTNAMVRMVMKKYKSFFNPDMMPFDKEGNNVKERYFIFSNIPANEEVVLISTKNVDGKIYLAIENAKTVSGTGNTVFNYKEVSQKELEEAVKNINL